VKNVHIAAILTPLGMESCGTNTMMVTGLQELGEPVPPVPLDVAPMIIALLSCLQCFDAVGWAAGRASGL